MAKLLASRAICRLANYCGKMVLRPPTIPTPVHPYRAGRSLSDIGLMDYNARFYDPLLGRFTSPDSIVSDVGSVIGYNRYAYVKNNPILYIDPSGHCYTTSGIWIPGGGDRACSFKTSYKVPITKVDPISGMLVSPDISDPGGVASTAGWDNGPDAAHSGNRTVHLQSFYLTTCTWDIGCLIGWEPYYFGVESERFDPSEVIIKALPGEVDETIDMYKAVTGNMLYMEPSGRKISDNISELFENDKPLIKFKFDLENGFSPGYEENVSTLYTPYVIIDNSNGKIVEYGIIEEPIKKIEGRFFFFDESTVGGMIFPSEQDPSFTQGFLEMKGW